MPSTGKKYGTGQKKGRRTLARRSKKRKGKTAKERRNLRGKKTLSLRKRGEMQMKFAKG